MGSSSGISGTQVNTLSSGGRPAYVRVMDHAQRTSPCLKVCTLDTSMGFCQGCGRSLREIKDWPRVTDAERERILAELPKRLAIREGR